MIRLAVGVAMAVVLSLCAVTTASALGLKVAPLEYRTELAAGEKKKGFLDISNPTTQAVVVKTSVRAFSQVDDNGSLAFVKNEAVEAGLRLDLNEFELGPREAIRMYFLLDGSKLPQGDVFAAIFAETQPVGKETAGVSQHVRIGTILSIVNGTAGSRTAAVTKLSTPFIQFGDTIRGTYTVKNTADAKRTTGFYPTVVTSVAPFGESEKHNSRLVFAGRSRDNDFTLPAPWLGFYQVKASYNDSSRSAIVFVARPLALLVVGVVLAAGATGLVAYRRWRHQSRRMRR